MDEVRSERADIAIWSLPLIADCLDMGYRACLGGDEELVRHLSHQHRRVWSFLVERDRSRAVDARRLLASLAKLCRVADDAIEAIDAIVLDELTEVVAQRYQNSPAKTRNYNRILIDVATDLTHTRLAHAA